MMSKDAPKAWIPICVMIAAPAFFSTNLIFGRFVAADTDPFVLAFVRWLSVAVILAPFTFGRGGGAVIKAIKDHWRFLLLLGFLGMGISGSGVYLGLKYTTATNATLIYSTTPILIIVLERLFAGRKSNPREALGIALAFLGVGVIVLKGDMKTLTHLTFNTGDLLIASAALSWAGYSIFYRSKRMAHLTNIQLFGTIAIFGALINLPMALYHLMTNASLPSSPSALWAISGIIFISSLMAFSAYQYGVRTLGASIAGLFMYLMTPYGVLMAVLFLDEKLFVFHFFGVVLVMTGIASATFPKSLTNVVRHRRS